MFRFIKRLQQKPVHVRKNVAFLVSAAITAIVIAVWVSTFDARFSPRQEREAPRAGTPFSLATGRIEQWWMSAKEQTATLREDIDEYLGL